MINKPEQIASDLSRIVKGDIYSDIIHRTAYSTDASIYRILPQCVVMPQDENDVAAVTKYAKEHNIPIVARGGGTGVAGESLSDGIVFVMGKYMNKILGVENNGEFVTCQPGAVLDELNQYLAKYGRKIGPDPSSASRALVGGCLANNATGAHSLQYGYMGDYVERIKAVTVDGDIVTFDNNFDPEITVEELKKKIDNRERFFLLDVREPIETRISSIGGELIPLNDLPRRINELNKDDEIIIY